MKPYRDYIIGNMIIFMDFLSISFVILDKLIFGSIYYFYSEKKA